MLYLIGLGLCDGKDITVHGKEAVKKCSEVYIESYTSLLQCSHEELEKDLGCSIKKLTREDVEKKAELILDVAKIEDVAILIIGDPFGATTHTDLFLRAKKAGVDIKIIHNTSILNAIGSVGLELYRYGKTVSLPYWESNYAPTSFIQGIKENFALGLHTLCLLDIKADKKRFMTVQEGLELLEKVGSGVITKTPVIGVARVGSPDQLIVSGTVQSLKDVDFGPPPHSIVIPGRLHPIEEEMLSLWKE